MNAVPFRRSWLLLAALGFVGCGTGPGAPPPRTNTGAEKTARHFYEALLGEDWSGAYADLDPQSKARCEEKKFAELARHFREQIGFAPTGVSVGANEQGDTATAVANFRGLSGTTIKQSKDGTSLRRTAEGWAVELRENFGKDPPKTSPAPRSGGKTGG